MTDPYPIGILGCGDYLRWEHEAIRDSERVRVRSLFDPARDRAEHYAEFFDARPVGSADAIFDDDAIRAILIFTPPWVRRELVLRAAERGKHIITVKPLAPRLEPATEMLEAARGRVRCAVFYRRTGNAEIETLKRIFDGGEIGRLALYRQDWLHHYPTWNEWATDPERNGGPFMDAMVHNLNTARHLAEGDVVRCTFFSDNHAQDLACNDTESMKLDFSDGAAAHLFITWAADLEIYDPTKNDREHIDIFYMVTDRGWHVTSKGGRIRAKKEDQVRTWPIEPVETTAYDRFVECIEADEPLPWDIVDAWKDIAIMERAAARPGQPVDLHLAPPV
jgi:predicted dehydrogenase